MDGHGGEVQRQSTASGVPAAPASADAVLAAAAGPLRMRSLLRATPLLAWATVASFAVLGLLYAIVVPLLHAPDEGAHVDRIATFDLGGQFRLDSEAPMTYSTDLLAAYAEVGIVPVDQRVLPRLPWTPLNTADATPVDDRPPYPDLAPPGAVDERFRNAAKWHPPGYYATVDGLDLAAEALGAPGVDEAGWDTTLARWRAWSVLLLLLLPWTAFWVAVRLAGRRRPGHAAAMLTLAAPQLSHAAGSVNNDALLLTGSAVCILATTWLATGDRSWAAATWAGAGAGMAVLAKVFGIAAPVWIVAAVLVAHRHEVRRAVQLVAVAAGATIAAGGWHVLLTLVRHGTPAPRDFNYPQPEGFEPSPLGWLREVVERLTSTGFGRLGVEHFGIPGWSVWAATLTTLALVAAGTVAVARRRPGQSHAGPALAAVMLLPFATTLAMVLYAAWGGYARSGIPSGLHGRYLFVAVPALAALAGIGLDRLAGRGRATLAVPLGLGMVLQGLGLVTALANWWPGGWWDRARTAMLFSGWSDPLLALLAAATVATLAALAVGLHREAATTVAATTAEPSAP